MPTTASTHARLRAFIRHRSAQQGKSAYLVGRQLQRKWQGIMGKVGPRVAAQRLRKQGIALDPETACLILFGK